ncbi:hypothetical protein [Bacillus sp. JCM 19041]|uniref:hypothetical protein n=1 Tax=Bacillus sp. JCM 19041 TaxID=1460637 RepID=UPI0006D1E857
MDPNQHRIISSLFPGGGGPGFPGQGGPPGFPGGGPGQQGPGGPPGFPGGGGKEVLQPLHHPLDHRHQKGFWRHRVTIGIRC